MSNTRALATEARELLAGKLGIVLPETVTLAGADTWLGDLPHKRTGPQQVRQKLIAEQWEIKRPVTSGGPRAQSIATRIEQPLNAIMKDEDAGFPDENVKDNLLIEGICFSTVSLAPTDWRQKATIYVPDRKMDEHGKIDNKYVEDRFAMDRSGRFRGDKGYDESDIDLDAMQKEAEEERRAHQARNLPFRQRAYSIRQCAPIWGSDFQLEGLIVETHWSAHEIRRRKMYVGKDKHGADCQLYPLGAIGEGDSGSGTSGKQVKVIEAWLLDDDGKPYLSYYVDGKNGLEYVFRMGKNGPEEYITDLSKIGRDKRGKWHGYSRLPISWGTGLGWSAADPDERTMPFTKPFQQGWRMADMIMTCVVASSLWLAFPALIEKVPFAQDDESLTEEDRKTPDISMLKITQVTGDITNVGGQGVHPSVFQSLGILMGENKMEAPGGTEQGADSGIGMSIAEATASDALTTVKRSALKMASRNASLVLEGAKILGECYDDPIRVYQIADVLIEQENPSDTNQMLELEPGWIGTSYDVKAVEKRVPGSNPALRQQNAALVKEGFYDKAWFYEQEGYPSPEEMAWRVQWETLINSEPGQQAILRMYTQYVSSDFVEQMQELIAAGQANQQGLPVGFADGVSPPPDMLSAGPQATGGMDGMGVPLPAEQQMNAAVGAGMQTGPLNAIAAQGGELPETALMGPVR